MTWWHTLTFIQQSVACVFGLAGVTLLVGFIAGLFLNGAQERPPNGYSDPGVRPHRPTW